MLAAEERPARVDGEDVLPHLERRLRRGGGRADAGHVDEDVDVTRDNGHLRLVAHIQVDVGSGDVRGDDLCVFGLEQARDCCADPRAGARHERTLAGEARHSACATSTAPSEADETSAR